MLFTDFLRFSQDWDDLTLKMPLGSAQVVKKSAFDGDDHCSRSLPREGGNPHRKPPIWVTSSQFPVKISHHPNQISDKMRLNSHERWTWHKYQFGLQNSVTLWLGPVRTLFRRSSWRTSDLLRESGGLGMTRNDSEPIHGNDASASCLTEESRKKAEKE